jgi:multidrug efflux pump subunit AcrA (membrane-fusion protein)
VLKPEMLVDVTFLTPAAAESDEPATEQTRLFVPERLLREDEQGSFVWLADQAAQVARKTRVQAGTVGSNGLVEITGGLTISSRVIVGGAEGLGDGQRILVTGETPSRQGSESERPAESTPPAQEPD